MRCTLALTCTLVLATPAFAACEDDLKATFEQMMAGSAYRSTITSSSDAPGTVMESEAILPDKFHIRADQMEMILIGKKGWMKMGGAWQQMPAEAAEQMSSMISDGVAQGMKGVSNVKCLGDQTYEGASYDTISYTSKGEFAGIASSSEVVLYRDGDGHPAWMVIDGEAMGVKSKTVQKITRDDTITINPPN
ncbi:MAG: hypothetical protein LCH46_05830 [Proteobacteria bacterium]|nr:hypothetical protein [Pseudomonadota bacterium]